MGVKAEFTNIHLKEMIDTSCWVEVIREVLVERGIVSIEELEGRVKAKKDTFSIKKALEIMDIEEEYKARLEKCRETGFTEEFEIWMRENLIKICSAEEVEEIIKITKMTAALKSKDYGTLFNNLGGIF